MIKKKNLNKTLTKINYKCRLPYFLTILFGEMIFTSRKKSSSETIRKDEETVKKPKK